jgi:predicted enzyme related to lactoylglutathione lyase
MNASPHVWSGVTIDCTDPIRLAAFWGTLLGLPSSEPLPGWVRLGSLGQATPAINFQPVPEPKAGKVRTHLDVRVDNIDDALLAVIELGGRSLNQRYDYDEGIVMTMADPEGNEFCIVEYFVSGRRRSGAAG